MPDAVTYGRHRHVTGRHRNVIGFAKSRRTKSALIALALAAGLLALSPIGPKRSGAASIMAPTVTTTVKLGTVLHAGASVVSGNKQFALTMQADGNLVLLGQGQVVWSAQTGQNPGAWAAMQGDGNLVIYRTGGVAVWNSHTSGHTDARLIVTTDGNLAITAGSSRLWQSGSVDTTLASGHKLLAGQSITSAHDNYVALMQTDGNFVMYGQSASWSSQTNGNPGAWANMQSDGNLVVYSAAGLALWSSHTYGKGVANLVVTDSNNLAVLSPSSAVYWQTAPKVTSAAGAAATPITGAGSATLQAGHTLLSGQALKMSTAYTLTMQTDGNLVLRSASKVLWATNTFGHPGSWLAMQGDGNVVIYSGGAQRVPLWSSKTYGSGATSVSVGSDGNILISTGSGVAVYEAPGGAQGVAIVAAARRQIGLPYCWDGGTQHGPNIGIDDACSGKKVGFDCSGLALYAVYQVTRTLLDHYSGSQYNDYARHGGIRVAKSALKPGDLVFFVGDDGNTVQPGHVGIYAGNGKIIDAQQDGVPVAVHNLYNDYVGAVRYWH
jgi:cell wall-associated NlpC family hydrolase